MKKDGLVMEAEGFMAQPCDVRWRSFGAMRIAYG